MSSDSPTAPLPIEDDEAIKYFDAEYLLMEYLRKHGPKYARSIEAHFQGNASFPHGTSSMLQKLHRAGSIKRTILGRWDVTLR